MFSYSVSAFMLMSNSRFQIYFFIARFFLSYRYIAHLQVRSRRRNRRDRTIAAMVVVIATLWDMSTATGPRRGATATPSQRSTEAALTTSDSVSVTTGVIQKDSMAHIACAKPQTSTSKATSCSGCIRQVA